jgi:hypothetical protein
VPGAASDAAVPFLYRVGGSHLLGTIHLPDDRVLRFVDVLEPIIAGADELITEIPMDPSGQLELLGLIAADVPDAPLSERLPPDLYARLEAYLAAKGLPVAVLEDQPVWGIASMLTLLDYLPQLAMGKPVLDQALWDRARALGVATGGLETPAEQLAAFADLGAEGQLRLLRQTLDQLEEAKAGGRDAMQDLLEAWLSGDGARLLELMRASVDEVFYARVLDDRSALMAERIAKRLAEHPGRTGLFAIGAGHLPGERGVISLLRARGLDVRRVR